MRSRLIVFSADPGGADCLIPVLKGVRARLEPTVLARKEAIAAFRRAGFAPCELLDEDLATCLDGPVAAVLTSASSLPERDMTEKLLWRMAQVRGLPSVAVLDQWQCYVERFSGPNGQERLGYLPTAIAVMDTHAREAMVREGFPAARLVVTGQPALEGVRGAVEAYRGPRSPGKVLRITHFSQPFRALFGDGLSLDERDALDMVREAIAPIGADRVHLVCRLHPRERREDFPPDAPGFEVQAPNVSSAQALAESDIVVGMSSIMLVHAVLASIPTFSVSPPSPDPRNACHPVQVGVIPRLTSSGEIRAYLTRFLESADFRQEVVRRLADFSAQEGASGAVLDLLDRLLA